MKKLKLIGLIAMIISLASCTTTNPKTQTESKPVILITAFGSSYESGMKNLEDMDKAYRNAFPETEIYWAFTADFIVNKLRKQGTTTIFERQTPLFNVSEAYEFLATEGKSNVAVQILMVMVGSEMRQVLNTPSKGLNIKMSYPLFYSPEDIQNTASALYEEFGKDNETYTILSAHGNDHHMVFNSELIEMDDYLVQNFNQVRVATVEGAPLFGQDLVDTIKASKASHVKFIPLMLTYGDHITNDVMGNEIDSWKTVIGLPATAADGMASNPAIQDIYISKTKKALSQF